ncbi:uncharacterized protein TNCV_1654481 [Trichonephila clavipes]|nr:uncharacterized protein TNCV_1654481 [Trichonephila clavipes]
MKEIISDAHFPKQKNRRVIFQCGDRVWLTTEHVVLFTATLPPQIRSKIGRKNCMKNIRVIRHFPSFFQGGKIVRVGPVITTNTFMSASLNTRTLPANVCRPNMKNIHWCAKIKDEVEKLAYQLNEEAERTERPIRRLSKVMYGSTCADMQVDVMGECLSSIKHVVGVRSVFLAKRLHAV